MPYLNAVFSVPVEISLDQLTSNILAAIPSARITSKDWYADRRQEVEVVVDQLRKKGSSISNEVVETVDRAAKRNGPTWEICIPMAGGSLKGRISLDGFLLLSDLEIDDQSREQLLRLLQSMGIIAEIELSNGYAPWKN